MIKETLLHDNCQSRNFVFQYHIYFRVLCLMVPESQPGSEWTVTHFRAVSLQVALRLAPETIVPKHLRYVVLFCSLKKQNKQPK